MKIYNMSNVFIFHGVGGQPEENWFPWLKRELEKLGHKVIVPQFPTPNGQTLENWLKVLENYKPDLNQDSILIGHSLGVSFVLNVIERQPVKAAFLVGGFIGKIGHFFDNQMKTFTQREFDWASIKQNCPKFHIYNSDNDPYIRVDKAEELSAKLATPVTYVKGAGHFNQVAGYLEFPLLLEDLKKVL
jgi:hypothetical protein